MGIAIANTLDDDIVNVVTHHSRAIASNATYIKELLRVTGVDGLSYDKAGGTLINGRAYASYYNSNDGGYRLAQANEIRFRNSNFSLAIAVGDSFGNDPTDWIDMLDTAVQSKIKNWAVPGARLYNTDAQYSIDSVFAAHISDFTYWAAFIQGGVNDVVVDNTLLQMQTGVLNMVAAATAVGITKFCHINIAPFKNYSSWSAPRQQKALDYNAWLANYCATTPGHTLVDIYTLLGASGDSTALHASYDSGDGLHPNAAGQVKIRDLILIKMAGQFPANNSASTMMHEPAGTNLISFGSTFGSWTKSNSGTGVAPVTNGVTMTGPDGLSGTRVRATFNSGAGTTTSDFSYIQSALGTTTIGQTYSSTIVMKGPVGGVAVVRPSLSANYVKVDLSGDWQTIQVQAVATSTSETISIGLRQGLSGIGTINSSLVLDLWESDCKASAYYTSLVPTTAGQATRLIDSIKIPLSAATNFNQTKGICLLKLKMNFANSATAKSLFATNTTATDFIHDNGSGAISLNDGTNTATADPTGWAAGDTLIIAAVWDTDTMSIHVKKNTNAWIDSSNTTYDGAFPAGANLLFCNGNTDAIDIYHAQIIDTNMTFAASQTWIKANSATLIG